MPPKRVRPVPDEEQRERDRLRKRQQRCDPEYKERENEKRRLAYATKKAEREAQHDPTSVEAPQSSRDQAYQNVTSSTSETSSQDNRRLRNRVSQANRRANPEVRQEEQRRNTLQHALRRTDSEYRGQEQLRDTLQHSLRRTDSEYRAQEQLRNTLEHSLHRINPEYREEERIRDASRHRDRRTDPIVRSEEVAANRDRRNVRSWDTVMREFSKGISEGPVHTCYSCDRLFFIRSIKLTSEDELKAKGCSDELLTRTILHRFYDEEIWKLCSDCHKNIIAKKIPKFNIQENGLAFPDVHPKIKRLYPLERRIVALRIPFMKIKALGCDRQVGIYSGIVNVPIDMEQIFSTIPIRPEDSRVIHLKLKRRMAYQTHYQYERIRPRAVYEAAEVLVGTTLYRRNGVTLDSSWSSHNEHDEIDFIANPDEVPIDVPDDDETSNASDEDVFEEATATPDEQLLGQETMIYSNHAVDFAPGEGQTPLPVLLDDNSEELSFPSIFAGEPRAVNKRLSYTDVVNSEIRRTDRRAVEPEHLLYAHKRSQLEQISSNVNIQVKKAAQGDMTVGNALDGTYMNNMVNTDQAFHILRNITGSPAYWEEQKKNVMAMVRQLGICTFFVTLSAAETHWKELHKILMKTVKGVDDADVENLTFEEKAELIRSDPVTCALYFEQRFKEVVKTWKNTEEGPFGRYKISHKYYRIEFQHRGSPHVHMLVWIEDAPTFNPDNPDNMDQIAAFIDSIISTNSDDPEIRDFIKYQYHRCTRTCHKTLRGKTQCRFGAPFPPMPRTTILTPLSADDDKAWAKTNEKENREFIKKMNKALDDLLRAEPNIDWEFDEFLESLNCTEENYLKILRSQLKMNKVFVKRRPNDCRINPYSKKILLTMQSNMDIQFILDPYACINYIVDYISKPSRGISKLLHNCLQNLREGNHTVLHRLRCVGNCFYNGCEISAQECAWCRLRLDMSRCSVKVEFVNTSSSNNRHRMLKPRAELQKLPPDSRDTFVPGPLERYAERPPEMADICYADFVACYNFTGKAKRGRRPRNNNDQEDEQNEADEENENDGNETVATGNQIILRDGFLTTRKQPKVLRFCRFDYHKDPNNFYRERIMLFKPWRNESSEVENVAWEQVFNAHREIITENTQKYIALDIDIEAILNDINQRSEEDEEPNETEDYTNVYDFDETNYQPNVLFDSGQDNAATVEAKKYNVPGRLNDDEYYQLCDSLNEKQRDYLLHILSCFKSNETPVYHFITGGAGVGKSRLIKAMYQTLIRLFETTAGEAGLPEILIVAFTGKAAHNVNGMTAHSAFSLPMISGSSSESFKGLGSETLNTCRVKLAKLKAIIIDEVSMMGSSMFDKIHLRCNQIFGNQDSNKIFGGKSVIVLGDFNQLQPVQDQFVFKPASNNVLNQLAGTPLWTRFKMYELDEIMRQRDDKVFAEALNRLAVGSLTQTDIDMFKSRCFTEDTLPEEGRAALRLMYTNDEVEAFNLVRANAIRNQALPRAISKAIDVVTGAANETERRQALHNLQNKPPSKTQGLSKTLTLQCSIHYMVTSNLSVADGLFNGATGVLRHIMIGQDQKPSMVYVEFEDSSIGKEARIAMRSVMLQNTVLRDHVDDWTPIKRVKLSFTTTRKQHVKIIRHQFPLVIAEAITIHKSQGSSLQTVTVSLPRNNIRALVYVALSRATSLNGLYLVGNFRATTPPDDTNIVVVEMARLRAEAILTTKFSFLKIIPDDCLQIMSHNVRSLKKHIESIRNDRTYTCSDIILAQETWLFDRHPNDLVSIDNKLVIARNQFSDPRSSAKGTIVFGPDTSEHLITLNRTPGCRIDLTAVKYLDLVIINIYKANETSPHNFRQIMDRIAGLLQSDNVLVCGDFNESLTNSNGATKYLLDTYDLRLLSPLMPTTNINCIDGIFGRLSDYQYKSYLYDSYFSDHKPVVIRLRKRPTTGATQELDNININI